MVNYVYGNKERCKCGVNDTTRKLEINDMQIPICGMCLIHLCGTTNEEIKRL
jgi:hypothetical protein